MDDAPPGAKAPDAKPPAAEAGAALPRDAMLPQISRPTAPCGATRDAFLGGRVLIRQPAKGYRAGVDAVLLAAACAAGRGDRVLDLGCGVGTASLCLAARVPELRVTGVERDSETAALARQNAAEAGACLDVVIADVAALPFAVRQERFNHVMLNPPYFRQAASVPSSLALREAAMGEETPLAAWLDVAVRRLAPKGWLTLIHQAERLDDVLVGLAGLGSIAIRPVTGRSGRPAGRIVVRARQGGRAPLRLLPPLVLHAGAAHTADAEDYTAQAAAILRGGEALSWPSR